MKTLMPSLTSLLTIIFVIAKLTGTVTWSWWIVFSPVLVSFGLVLFVLILAIVVALILAIAQSGNPDL